MTEEEKKVPDEEAKVSEETTTEEVKVDKKEDFTEEEFVPKNKYNQTLRKLRELELEKIELARKVAVPAEPPVQKVQPKPAPVAPQEKNFWEPEEEEKIDSPKELDEDIVAKLVEDKLKPIYAAQKDSYEKAKKNDRAIFFEKHPKYLQSSEEFASLMDVLDRSINPNSGDSYIEQLEMARILHESSTATNPNVENFKKSVASEAANIAPQGTSKTANTEGITPEDRRIMKEYNISEEGMMAYKKKIKNGDMLVLGMQ